MQEERRGEWSQIPARAHEHRPPIVGNSKDVDGMKIQIGRPRAVDIDVMSRSRSPSKTWVLFACFYGGEPQGSWHIFYGVRQESVGKKE